MASSLFTPSFLQGLTAEELKEARDAELADEVAGYFKQNRRLKYIGVAGLGTHGGALLFREFDDEGRPVRRIIVKYPINDDGEAHIRNEEMCLRLMRGSEHVVQLLSLPGAEINVLGTGKRPTIALEFMEHGDAHQLRQRLANADITVAPSRLLWRIFLCLIRQCVAMAYPPNGGDNAPITPDEIRDGVAPFALTQNSPHPGNIVFGDLSADFEHNLVPLVKLIDFGRGQVEQDPYYAHFLRIRGAAYLLMCCALPTMDLNDLRIRDYDTPARYTTVSGELIETFAHFTFLNTENMDYALRDVVAMCLHGQYVPPLEQILAWCMYGVQRQLPDFDNEYFAPLDRENETDEGIRNLVKYAFLDGDVRDAPQNISRPTVYTQVGTSTVGLFASQNARWEHGEEALWRGINRTLGIPVSEVKPDAVE
ncbi:hypothetical protein F5Y13DRAFT_191572 [Hypoxylon sp. FL1857]|nr:hypothetical protein F5Y13DRAFT_191572 [Hypoxylon sp. FL1857]